MILFVRKNGLIKKNLIYFFITYLLNTVIMENENHYRCYILLLKIYAFFKIFP